MHMLTVPTVVSPLPAAVLARCALTLAVFLVSSALLYTALLLCLLFHDRRQRRARCAMAPSELATLPEMAISPHPGHAQEFGMTEAPGWPQAWPTAPHCGPTPQISRQTARMNAVLAASKTRP